MDRPKLNAYRTLAGPRSSLAPDYRCPLCHERLTEADREEAAEHGMSASEIATYLCPGAHARGDDGELQ